MPDHANTQRSLDQIAAIETAALVLKVTIGEMARDGVLDGWSTEAVRVIQARCASLRRRLRAVRAA